MKPHKWQKEIHAFADGAVIEGRPIGRKAWVTEDNPSWNAFEWEFRIAPIQPADDEGWMNWYSGENPAGDAMVDIKWSCGSTLHNLPAYLQPWGEGMVISYGHIIAWRFAAKKKKVLYRWLLRNPMGGHRDSIFYYVDADDVEKDGHGCTVIQRLDYTRIEVYE